MICEKIHWKVENRKVCWLIHLISWVFISSFTKSLEESLFMRLKALNIMKYLIISGTRNWNGIKFGQVFRWVYPQKTAGFSGYVPVFWTLDRMSHVSMTVYQKLCNCKSIIHRRHWIADSCRVQTVSDSPWLSATENLLLVERRTLSAVVSESLVLHYGWCVQTVIKMCPLRGIWGDQQPTFYFGTHSISPKLIELGSWNLAHR